jgi:hypothetical protein
MTESNSNEGSFGDPYVTSIASAPLDGYRRQAETPLLYQDLKRERSS